MNSETRNLTWMLKDCLCFLPTAEMEEMAVLQKAEKVPERCKYWPACKNGDECAFHHPTLPCKLVPKSFSVLVDRSPSLQQKHLP